MLDIFSTFLATCQSSRIKYGQHYQVVITGNSANFPDELSERTNGMIRGVSVTGAKQAP